MTLLELSWVIPQFGVSLMIVNDDTSLLGSANCKAKAMIALPRNGLNDIFYLEDLFARFLLEKWPKINLFSKPNH